MRLVPGRPWPIGAQPRDGGVNFAVWSLNASAIELCLFDAQGREEVARLALHGPLDGIWHGFLPGAGAGLVYGLRAHGPFQPDKGHRFNPHKLLLDPWAKEVVGDVDWRGPIFGYPVGGTPDGFDARDSAASVPKARVVAPWTDDPARPRRPLHAAADRVIYEVHVANFTRLNEAIPQAWRGRYAGLGHPASIEHLKALGVTTVHLLPVMMRMDEMHLVQRGLTNHWGYNTLAFFVPEPRLSTTPGDPAATRLEFRAMVDALHAAGLEVVLDVVFNHTAEADASGPTLSWRGLDHAAWYRLVPQDPRWCENWSGCGNTVDSSRPRVIQFVMDVLRHWAGEYGVDGFRFDLAPTLGRQADGGFTPESGFLVALAQDPLLADRLLIAEPWDLGPHGYQVGAFPSRWIEWNDGFRDTLRRVWLRPAAEALGGRHAGLMSVSRGQFAHALAGSSGAFRRPGRPPQTSVNFVAAHDGFTLADTCSHSTKHNEANGEGNRDGRGDEPAANLGQEGDSDDPRIVEVRRRLRRAMLGCLMLAPGTPMLTAGDELAHSQQGNNNAYAQDGPISWIDWQRADREQAAYVGRLARLRRSEPGLCGVQWWDETPPDAVEGEGLGGPGRSVSWLRPEGGRLRDADWAATDDLALALRVDAVPAALDVRGEVADGHAVLLLVNPGPRPRAFLLPAPGPWLLRLDTSASSEDEPPAVEWQAGASVDVPAHAMLLLRQRRVRPWHAPSSSAASP